ncbi:MetQ/NlpA family ABC transporter substrate-binding protein [Carnimonas bestiolae]|uniref:MetQ/NlpA family ABC transporter substrate-binding protein n=1 Tax=Carnimonas bestiolae TaxID=3402172 RepID=UPI003EDC3BB3
MPIRRSEFSFSSLLHRSYSQRRVIGRSLMACALIVGMGAASQAMASVTVAITGGPTGDAIYKAAELAKQQGVDVQVREFSDWVTPNSAVVNGDADINYFQHRPFLANAEKQAGFTLAPLAFGVENNIGLYSNTLKKAGDIQPGGRVAIADDPVNQSRGLRLLEEVGLIKLKPGVGDNATLFDIEDNPKQLKFTELPGPQLVRSLQDVDIAEGYPADLIGSGVKDPTDALALTHDKNRTYALVFAVRPEDVKRKDINTFIHIYQTAPEVREILAHVFGSPKLYQLAWLDSNGKPGPTPLELEQRRQKGE